MDESNTPTQPRKLNPAIPVVVVLLAIIVAVTVFLNRPTQNLSENTSVTPSTVENTPAAMKAMEETTASAYKDGEYTVTGEYTSPGGQEELGVTVTLTKGVISDVTVTPMATRPISKTRQEDFTANFKDQVVGKNIDEVSLGKVSGSSLSPKGFNDAVTKIKAEASA